MHSRKRSIGNDPNYIMKEEFNFLSNDSFPETITTVSNVPAKKKYKPSSQEIVVLDQTEFACADELADHDCIVVKRNESSIMSNRHPTMPTVKPSTEQKNLSVSVSQIQTATEKDLLSKAPGPKVYLNLDNEEGRLTIAEEYQSDKLREKSTVQQPSIHSLGHEASLSIPLLVLVPPHEAKYDQELFSPISMTSDSSYCSTGSCGGSGNSSSSSVGRFSSRRRIKEPKNGLMTFGNMNLRHFFSHEKWSLGYGMDIVVMHPIKKKLVCAHFLEWISDKMDVVKVHHQHTVFNVVVAKVWTEDS